MDEDGYAIGDPYAAAAKMIDKREKEANSISGKLNKLSKTIIENKDTVTYWEKICKAALVLIIIAYMVISNDDAKNTSWEPTKDVFKALFNTWVWKDFMSREGVILIVFVGGYLLANKYNQFLDACDLEYYNIDKKKRAELRK